MDAEQRNLDIEQALGVPRRRAPVILLAYGALGSGSTQQSQRSTNLKLVQLGGIAAKLAGGLGRRLTEK